MKSISPKEVSTAIFHSYMLSAVAPRPIALVSTIDAQGQVNLSPFSFFNAFSANPPILIFSPARRVRDNTTKHTLGNVLEVPEAVIHIVDYQMVEQCSLASTEYDKGVDEFVKAGFAPSPSLLVKPPMIRQAPASFECKVQQVLPMGDQGGAGNLVICEVLMMHVREDIVDHEGKIDPLKMDIVSRCGGNFYGRVNAANLFEIEKPILKKGIGIDQLPTDIQTSPVLTGNQLAQLANIEKIPDADVLQALPAIEKPDNLRVAHQKAAELLDKKQVLMAWKVLLSL